MYLILYLVKKHVPLALVNDLLKMKARIGEMREKGPISAFFKRIYSLNEYIVTLLFVGFNSPDPE